MTDDKSCKACRGLGEIDFRKCEACNGVGTPRPWWIPFWSRYSHDWVGNFLIYMMVFMALLFLLGFCSAVMQQPGMVPA